MKKKEMTDEQMREMLQEFAQGQSVALGGHIKVEIKEHSTRFIPEFGYSGFKYEDSQYLTDTIRGAQSFLYWLHRAGKRIV